MLGKQMLGKQKIGIGNLSKISFFLFIGMIMFSIPLAARGAGPRSATADDALYVHYQFESLQWNGEPDEVIDNMGHVHGMAHGAHANPNGKIKRCAFLDGTGYIELSQNVLLSPTFSISTWINIDNDSSKMGYKPIFTQGAETGNKFSLRINGSSNKIELFMQGSEGNRKEFLANASLINENWYHVVVLFSKTNIKLYLNDALKIDAAHGTDGNFQDYVTIRTLGGHPSEGYFHGKIDDFRVYDNYLLTTVEISSLYNLEEEPAEEEEEEEEVIEEESGDGGGGSSKKEKKETTTANETATENETAQFPITFNVFEIYGWLVERLGPNVAFWFTTANLCISSLALTIFRFYVYQKRPILFTNHEKKYGSHRLGRLISCDDPKQNQLIGYNRFLIRNKIKGFLPYYCTLHAVEVLKKAWRTENWGLIIYKFLPHFYVKNVMLPPQLQFSLPVLKETTGNKVKYYFYRFFNLLPFLSITRVLYNSLEFDTKKAVLVDEIRVIQLEYLMKRKHFEYFTEFEKKEYNEKFAVFIWVKYPELALKSIIQDGTEYFIDQYRNFLIEYVPLKEKLDQLPQNEFENDTSRSERIPEDENELIPEDENELITEIPEEMNYIIPLSTENNPYLELTAEISTMFSKHGMTEELLESFEGILKILEEARKYQEQQIKHGVMDEKDQYSFLTLDEINALENDKDTYRNVEKIGEPIPKIRKLDDINQAIQYAMDLREQRELYELKLQTERVRIMETEKKLDQAIDDNTRLHVDMRKKVQEKIKKIRQLTKGSVESNIEFTAKVMELVDHYGLDMETAMKEVTKELLEKKEQGRNSLKQLEINFEELKKQVSSLPKNKQLEILLTDESNEPIRSLKDVKRMKDPDDGGYYSDE